ncbi:MAG TPA: glycoside hydrolase family 15 protein [Candidatus Saccharimonadales bacterium]|nr:glycoside hydrolase family 15 protein [Candidatus Saccharimonadales bacterium]
MGRPVVLSNGQLFVGLDETGLVHDFYYPYVGLDNLTNARSTQHKIGVWVDGSFSWVGEDGWSCDVVYKDDTLISSVTMTSTKLAVELSFNDFIDPEHNGFARRVTVTNTADARRDIRIFMHQVFQISRAGRADTAMYVPDDNYILDYKGRCCLLISGQIVDGDAFDQFAVGSYGIEGKAGTFKDAEDGVLSDNAVEHGGVDSVIRFRNETEAQASFTLDYWIIAADSQQDAEVVHGLYKNHGLAPRLQAAAAHWDAWLQPSQSRLSELDNQHRRAVVRSMLIIKAHCDVRGSILASGDSSIFNYGRDYYCYCWPRDGAYAVWPLMRLGQYDEAKKFFEFARDTMHRDGYLMHKYQPDRAVGSTWHPMLHGKNKELAIQEDETASVVFMIGEYFRMTDDRAYVETFYDTFISPTATFMTGFIDEHTGLPHASYDLWEQRFLTNTYTVCLTIAALETAAELATAFDHPADAVTWTKAADAIRANLTGLYHPEGYFRKGFLLQDSGDLQYNDMMDISNLYGPYMYAQLPLDSEQMQGTLRRTEERLLNTSPVGGVVRDEDDNYFLTKQQYKGNPWIVCTLWLAQYYCAVQQADQAKQLVDWALARQLPSGVLSEQFDPETGAPLSVAPLVWSHAELINTILDLSKLK